MHTRPVRITASMVAALAGSTAPAQVVGPPNGPLVVAGSPESVEIFWDGDCGNSLWLQGCPGATNWNPETTPADFHEVIISDAEVVVQAGMAEARSITQTGSQLLSIASNGSLTIHGPFETSRIVRLSNGGIVVANGPLELTGAGGNFKRFGATGPLINRGTFTLGNQSQFVSPLTVENRGLMRAGGTSVDAEASLTNVSGGTVELLGNLNAISGAGNLVNMGGSFVVDGVVAGTSAIVQQESGDLSVRGGGQWIMQGLRLRGGTVNIDASSVLRVAAVNNVIIDGGMASGAGVFEFATGSFGREIIRGDVKFDLNPPAQFEGGLRISTDTIEFESFATLTNMGQMAWKAGGASGDGTIRN